MSQVISPQISIIFDNKKVIIIAISIQIAFLGALGLEWLGLKIPILREVLGFVYLTFVPGILILRVLNFDFCKLNTWLYGIGVSVAFLMFTGTIISLVYPVFGIKNPLSVISLLTTISIVVTLLCFLIYIRRDGSKFIIRDFLSPFFLLVLLLLLPVLIAIGGFLIQYHGNSIFMMVLLMLIAMFPVLVVYGKIPKKFFALAVFVVFLSLLYHNSLSTPFFFGRDIVIERYYANTVYLASRWFPSLPESHNNSLLGNVILSPVYSNILGISLTWIIKLLYPFLFSIALVALYQAFKSQMDEKMAFLSCFFFASLGINYEELLATLKHPMTVFFISFLTLLVVENIRGVKKAFLSIVFVSGLAVSHYGVPYVFLFSSLFVLILICLNKKLKKFRIDSPLTTNNFVLVLGILVTAWFIYTSAARGFMLITGVPIQIASGIAELFAPVERGGVYFLTIELPSWEWEVLRVLHVITQFFILFGFLTVLYQKLVNKRNDIQDEYFFYSAAFLGWLGASILTPIVAGGPLLGVARIYGLSVIFLAPFCLIAGRSIVGSIGRLIAGSKVDINGMKENAIKIIAIFLFVFLIFNTRLVMEVNQQVFGGDGYVKSPSISQPRIMAGQGSSKEIAMFFRDYTSKLDVVGAKWLKEHRNEKKMIITDFSSLELVYAMIPNEHTMEGMNLSSFVKNIRRKEAYVFLRESNIKFDLMSGAGREYWKTSEILPILEAERNKIYSTGGSIIYYE